MDETEHPTARHALAAAITADSKALLTEASARAIVVAGLAHIARARRPDRVHGVNLRVVAAAKALVGSDANAMSLLAGYPRRAATALKARAVRKRTGVAAVVAEVDRLVSALYSLPNVESVATDGLWWPDVWRADAAFTVEAVLLCLRANLSETKGSVVNGVDVQRVRALDRFLAGFDALRGALATSGSTEDGGPLDVDSFRVQLAALVGRLDHTAAHHVTVEFSGPQWKKTLDALLLQTPRDGWIVIETERLG